MGAKQVPKSIGGGKMNGMTFLGEDDFIEAMNSDNKKWRDEKVRQGTLKTKDGINLNYYYAKNDEAKGVVIFVHGFCEFWGKYHEYAWYVYRAGYSFYFLEQRGFGLSEGKTDDPDIVYIDDFLGFTPQEYNVFENILKKAEEVTVAVSCDNLEPKDKETDVFYFNKRFAQKLIEIADRNETEIEEVKLEYNKRTECEDLRYLENAFSSSIPVKLYDKTPENIQLFLKHLKTC